MVAIKSCDPRKSPGYDGYNLKFILRMWNIVGNNILNFVTSFFQGGSTPTSINTTWVVLIPKVENADSIEDFRPVSMVGYLYKISNGGFNL